MVRNEKLQEWGLKRVSWKKRIWLAPNTGDRRNRAPKNAPEMTQKYDSNVEILQKKRRNVRGLGYVEELNQRLLLYKSEKVKKQRC